MDKLVFNYNWNNKLGCNAFTTIRLMSSKYQVGAKLEIIYKDMQPFIATVKAVKAFQLAGLNDFMAYIDTGYDCKKCTEIIETMYKNMKGVNVKTARFAFVLLVKDKA